MEKTTLCSFWLLHLQRRLYIFTMERLSSTALHLVYGVSAVVVLAYSFEYLISSRDEVREPPRPHARILLIGHLLGIITCGPLYHSKLRYAPPPPRSEGKPCHTTTTYPAISNETAEPTVSSFSLLSHFFPQERRVVWRYSHSVSSTLSRTPACPRGCCP